MKIITQKKLNATCLAILFIILLTSIDQITKYLAVKNIRDSSTQSIPVLKGVFRLTYLENKGAAWGILPNMQFLFIILSFVLLGFIAYYYWKIPLQKKHLPLRIIAITLSAGAIGNMIDRIWHGYVVDFFEFLFISFPVFNVADIYVTVSAALLLFLILFVYKEEDLLFLKKNNQETSR